MSTHSIDLWPNDFGTVGVKPPVTVFCEQATLLAKKTNGIVEAEVRTSTEGDQFSHRFSIVAPALGGYRYLLFTLDHDVNLYPSSMYFQDNEQHVESEDVLIDILRTVFASDEAKRVIHSLIAQSKA